MLNKYKNWLIVNENSDSTVKSYIQRITDFLKETSIDSLDEDVIINYVLKLKEKLSSSTVNGYKCAIKSFLEFLKKDIKVPRPAKIEEKLPEFIDRKTFEDEVVKMAEVICPNPLKVKATLYFLFFTGIRESELLSLKRKDINLETRTAKIKIKKTKKENLVIFPEKVRDIIKHYFTIEPEKINAFNMTLGNIDYIFRVLNPYFKNIHLHIHLFRHSFATYLRSKNFGIEDIKELMGHKSIQSTMKYAHADINKIKEKYDKKIK